MCRADPPSSGTSWLGQLGGVPCSVFSFAACFCALRIMSFGLVCSVGGASGGSRGYLGETRLRLFSMAG